MNLIKNRIRKNFTMIPNNLIEDNTISDRGRFLFVYLASKSDEWSFYNKQLCKALSYSEDTLRKYMLELESKGWITRYLKNRSKGRFSSNIYVIHESPNSQNFDLSLRKNTDTGKTVSKKYGYGTFPTHTNTNNKQKEKIIKNKFYDNDKSENFLNPRKKWKPTKD